jgi:methylenetetrahydrofolate dehydrogenase (NADP+)/methenyltetrahydrofolate cyclohydrolase
LMLQAADATVSVAHSRTADLAALTRQADVLVVAAGRPGMIGAEHVKPGAVVVDVGIHRIEPDSAAGPTAKAKLCGDVRYQWPAGANAAAWTSRWRICCPRGPQVNF